MLRPFGSNVKTAIVFHAQNLLEMPDTGTAFRHQIFSHKKVGLNTGSTRHCGFIDCWTVPLRAYRSVVASKSAAALLRQKPCRKSRILLLKVAF